MATTKQAERLPEAGKRKTKRVLAAAAHFNTEAEHLLVAAGGVRSGDALGAGMVDPTSPQYTVETRAGAATFRALGLWVAIRFDDTARARAAGYDCNPYSGKWNRHYFGWPAADALADLAGCLSRMVRP